MHYGPLSYHTLGRVFPRARLRDPYWRRPARMDGRLLLYPVVVPGPYCIAAFQAHTAGAAAAQAHAAGAVAAQAHTAGAVAAQGTCQ